MIIDKIESCTGSTPMLKLDNISNGKCTFWLKMESFNPTGSLKDRVALYVVDMIEKERIITEGGTIIVPTSGNLGISFSMICASRGYKCICVMEKNIPVYVKKTIMAYGGRIVYIDNDTIWSSEQRLKEAYNIQREISNSWVFDQYNNLWNSCAHYWGTGKEIIEVIPKPSLVVAPISTGGSLSGISLACKEVNKETLILGVEPVGSTIFYKDKGLTLIDSIGLSFKSDNINMAIIDGVIRVSDFDSYKCCDYLAKKEGVFAGDSTGASLSAAIFASNQLDLKGDIVVLMPDGGEKYIDTFYNDKWLEQHKTLLQNNIKIAGKKPQIKFVNKKQTNNDISKSIRYSPDFFSPIKRPIKVASKIYDLIGDTPLVKINTGENNASIFLKMEKFNPSGSAKDRAAISMIANAEKEKKLSHNKRIVESSSGNTGTALSMIGAAKGYNVTCIVENETSVSKKRRITIFGSSLIEVEADPYNISAVNDRIELALKMQSELEDVFVPYQYGNMNNPLGHYLGTGKEICGDVKVDCFISNISTGGTLTGSARRIKEINPECVIVGVEPYGSVIFGGTSSSSFIEGAGLPFIPDNLDLSLVDEGIKVDDSSAFRVAREFAKNFGILVGGSTGALLKIALEKAKNMSSDQNIVVIVHDGGEKYLDTIYDEEWISKNMRNVL